MTSNDRTEPNSEAAGVEIADLYERYRSPLTNYLTRLTRDRHTAEDVCQESFAKLIRSWGERDPQKDAVAWLYRIATNAAFDELRRTRRRQAGPSGTWQAADRTVHPEVRVSEALAVRAALARLSPTDREVLVLQAYEDRSLRDISALLQCSLGATKSRLNRARERFRQVYRG